MVDQTLFNWVKAHRQGKLKVADSKPKVSAEQMETAQLRAELARVKMERDILGKGDPQWPCSGGSMDPENAYFAKGSA